jgi:hypothetical protein
LTTSGLPLSLQIVCRGGDEAMALRIGWAWQSATDCTSVSHRWPVTGARRRRPEACSAFFADQSLSLAVVGCPIWVQYRLRLAGQKLLATGPAGNSP